MRCVIYIISGNVQGVGFRWSVRNKSKDFGLTGTVKNLPDGTVQIYACADDWGLEQLEKWLKEGGPEHASIKNIEKEKVESDSLPVDFKIV